MRFFRWEALRSLPELLKLQNPDLQQHAARIRYMERNVALPVKAAVVLVLSYYLFYSNWFETASGPIKTIAEDATLPRAVALETIRRFFLIYVVLNGGIASLLIAMDQLPLKWIQHVVFTGAWIDGVFLAALTLITGGFDSVLYWGFLGLIVRNAVSNPDTIRQILLNLFISGCYLLAGVMDIFTTRWENRMMEDNMVMAIAQGPTDYPAEPFALRLCLLVLMTACCYGVQVLVERQRRAESEAREFALRQEQLQATGRLAAEIAHQLKNPLGIINNAAFTLQRTVKEGKTITQQIQIIREEVDRSDRILTELMGYARLSEGRVEKLDITAELDRALAQVFPAAAKYEVTVLRDYGAALPTMLAQRGHMSEVFVNILQNAREAMGGKGVIKVSAHYGGNFDVIIRIEDNGPGIPKEKLDKIFEPYFTTKEKGTGLGLAIVKHNTELYNGAVQVESELDKGTIFTIRLPAKTIINIKK
jgi:signal transduction histidine kinase